MMLLQTGAVPTTVLELIAVSSLETKIVLAVIAVFSLAGWFVIGVKWWQYRRLNRQAERFFAEMERSTRLDEAYQHVMRQPTSPYTRLFSEAIQFYN
jgi:biopolymer transport protein ExbB/TolQ